ncbi:MAG: GtrA family protein [Clostridia bacterium]|jgi:putative flippase GtrA|nr:GtrA family protein [Clostridia bacterium]
MKKLISAVCNKETFTYVLFGGMTTLVNLVVFKVFDLFFGGKWYLLSNTIAWITAVAFAFITNKLFVFESKEWTFSTLKKEIPGFFFARIGSYFIEQGGLWCFVELLHFDEKVFDFRLVQLSGKIVAKLIIGVVVVVLNYLFSKFVVFKKQNSQNDKEV